jgi:hypothetical protein
MEALWWVNLFIWRLQDKFDKSRFNQAYHFNKLKFVYEENRSPPRKRTFIS